MTEMKTPEQLTTFSTANTTRIGTADAGNRSTGLGSLMGTTWSDRIVFDAQPLRVVSKYFIEFNDLLNNNDVSLQIPKIGDVNLMGGRTGDFEGQSRTWTEFSTSTSVDVILSATDVKLGGCLISFETVSATRVSIVEMAHKQLVRQYLNTIELDANSTLEGASSPAVTVYGGDATSTGTVETGDVLTIDDIVDLKIGLQEKDFGNMPGDAVLLLNPTQFKQLLKSSQFTNAAEFGGDAVVRKGVVEDYIGCKVEVSTLVGVKRTTSGDSYTTAAQTWGAGSLIAGHYCYMIDPSAAAGLVWKEKAKVKVVTDDDERVHKVLLDTWYKMKRINENAISIGVFSDS